MQKVLSAYNFYSVQKKRLDKDLFSLLLLHFFHKSSSKSIEISNFLNSSSFDQHQASLLFLEHRERYTLSEFSAFEPRLRGYFGKPTNYSIQTLFSTQDAASN